MVLMSGPNDIIGTASLKPRLASLHNSQQPMIKLPSELVLEIGEHLLERPPFRHDKFWFSKVLPLMQTSVQLRAALGPLLSETLTCFMYVGKDGALAEALQQLEQWKKEWPHELRVRLIVNVSTKDLGLKPSDAAAIAGDLERAIYGTLLDEPAVFVRCESYVVRFRDSRWLFVSSRRGDGVILVWPMD